MSMSGLLAPRPHALGSLQLVRSSFKSDSRMNANDALSVSTSVTSSGSAPSDSTAFSTGSEVASKSSTLLNKAKLLPAAAKDEVARKDEEAPFPPKSTPRARIRYMPYGLWCWPRRLERPPNGFDKFGADVYTPRDEEELYRWNLALAAEPWALALHICTYFLWPLATYEVFWRQMVQPVMLGSGFADAGAGLGLSMRTATPSAQLVETPAVDVDYGDIFEAAETHRGVVELLTRQVAPAGDATRIVADVAGSITTWNLVVAVGCMLLSFWTQAKVSATPFPHTGSTHMNAYGTRGRVIYLTRHGQVLQQIHYSVQVIAYSFALLLSTLSSGSVKAYYLPQLLRVFPPGVALVLEGRALDNLHELTVFLLKTSAQNAFFVGTVGSAVTVLYFLLVLPDPAFVQDCERYITEFGLPLKVLQNQTHVGLLLAALAEAMWQMQVDSVPGLGQQHPLKQLSRIDSPYPLGYFFFSVALYQTLYFALIVVPNYWETGHFPYMILARVHNRGAVGWLAFLAVIGTFVYLLHLMLLAVHLLAGGRFGNNYGGGMNTLFSVW